MNEPLQFQVDEHVARVFPELRVGLLRVSLPPGWAWQSPPEEADHDLPSLHGITQDNLAEHPAIRNWREAFRLQGLKPSDWRSSIEALVRRLLKKQGIRCGIPFVDLYNHVSMKTLVPMGAYDLSAFAHPTLVLRKIVPDDVFESFDGKVLDAGKTPSAIVYASRNEVVCFGFNYRDAARTAVSADSRDIVLTFDCVSASQYRAQDAALAEFRAVACASSMRCGDPIFADVRTSATNGISLPPLKAL
jgi:lysyl-tRNA synthetase class 2